MKTIIFLLFAVNLSAQSCFVNKISSPLEPFVMLEKDGEFLYETVYEKGIYELNAISTVQWTDWGAKVKIDIHTFNLLIDENCEISAFFKYEEGQYEFSDFWSKVKMPNEDISR